jgi:hypothetical protein
MFKKLLYLVSLSLLSVQAHSALFSDRTGFDSELASEQAFAITDPYDLSTYRPGRYRDIAMSAVLGETRYQATGYSNLNFIVDSGGNGYYCAGCDGSFLLDFTTTSIGSSSGVYGVGFDIIGEQSVFGTTAFVTLGDNSVFNYLIPGITGSSSLFWGITDAHLIRSIHFGLANRGISKGSQRMALDNLTIGAVVPVPAAIWLFGTALIGFIGMSRKTKV